MALENWTFKNAYLLTLMTLGYVVGEIAHFLINTSSRAVARDVQFGDKSCYLNITHHLSWGNETATKCEDLSNEDACTQLSPECEWNYDGTGSQYQILSGPIFVGVFTVSCLIVGFTSDKIRYSWFGRPRLMAMGILVFSVSCMLMGLSNAFWQLVILRVGIAAGEAACRPTSGGIIADAFAPCSRGLATGIFSWGVYYGYGLAYVLGITLTNADVMGYGWRFSYVISAVPGLVIAVLLATTTSDPSKDHLYEMADEETNNEVIANFEEIPQNGTKSNKAYMRLLVKSFLGSAAMMFLLLGACIRQLAGLTWAFNTRPYFQRYHPTFTSLSYWLLVASIGGGGFGVFFGGYFSDKLVKKLGLHSRLWILSGFSMLAVIFAVLTISVKPPYALVCLILYYFCAETWFAILFTVIVEICEPEVRSTSIALFLFIMNNVGGTIPYFVDPVSKLIGLRKTLYIFWPGSLGVCSVIFFAASLPLMRKHRASSLKGE